MHTSDPSAAIASPQASRTLIAVGLQFGPYTVVALLGKGGMGEVYRAHDTRLGRDVALKLLPAGMADDPDAVSRFEREARAVAALNHPAIVALHDVGTQDGVTYVVTEVLEGETLRDRIDREGPIPPRKAMSIATQVAQGLGAAHARGIIHRDIKPENLFLLEDGRVKVLDFGIARQMPQDAASQETTLVTRPGIIMGTFGYLAPEVIRGEPATAQSDMFAFGLVFYEALTGVNPFRRDTVAETVSAVLRDEPPPIGRAVHGLAPAAARLIHRCLERRPENRPDSLRDVAFLLEGLDSEAVTPAMEDPATGLRAMPNSADDVSRLRRWLLAAVAASLLAFMLAMYAYLFVLGTSAPVGNGGGAERLQRVVAGTHQQRLEMMQMTARLVGSFPSVKALIDTDAATLRVFLEDYQRTTRAPLLAVLNLDGRIVAATDDSVLAPLGTAAELASLTGLKGGSVIAIGGRPYHAASSLAEAAGTVFGVVVAASPVDDNFARDLGDATEGEVVLLDDTAVRGATLRAATVPWRTLTAWRASGGRAGQARDVVVGSQAFEARELALGPDGTLAAIVLRSRETAAAPYQRVRAGLPVIAGVLLLAGGALSVWLSPWLVRNRQRS